MIDRNRVKHELDALADCFEEVRFDLDEGWVELEPVLLLDGWNRETTALRIELPEYYPHGWPKLYVPDELRFNDKRPSWMLCAGKDGWSRYDHYRFEWNPKYHTVASMLRILDKSLRNPDDPDSATLHTNT